MQEIEKPSLIRKFMEKTAKRKTFYISDVFAVFWLLLFLLVRPTWPEVVAFFHLIAFSAHFPCTSNCFSAASSCLGKLAKCLPFAAQPVYPE